MGAALELLSEMTKLFAIAALAGLGLTATATPAQANTVCYWENGRQVCASRNVHVSPRRNVDVRVNGNTGGAAVRVQGPAGTRVRVYR
ncbi:Uncharacterized secreted protein [Synechococcus sp. RCC307]|nr:Uncharacterized secreted protein [Synechococcus sp. RCC307]